MKILRFVLILTAFLFYFCFDFIFEYFLLHFVFTLDFILKIKINQNEIKEKNKKKCYGGSGPPYTSLLALTK